MSNIHYIFICTLFFKMFSETTKPFIASLSSKLSLLCPWECKQVFNLVLDRTGISYCPRRDPDSNFSLCVVSPVWFVELISWRTNPIHIFKAFPVGSWNDISYNMAVINFGKWRIYCCTCVLSLETDKSTSVMTCICRVRSKQTSEGCQSHEEC